MWVKADAKIKGVDVNNNGYTAKALAGLLAIGGVLSGCVPSGPQTAQPSAQTGKPALTSAYPTSTAAPTAPRPAFLAPYYFTSITVPAPVPKQPAANDVSEKPAKADEAKPAEVKPAEVTGIGVTPGIHAYIDNKPVYGRLGSHASSECEVGKEYGKDFHAISVAAGQNIGGVPVYGDGILHETESSGQDWKNRQSEKSARLGAASPWADVRLGYAQQTLKASDVSSSRTTDEYGWMQQDQKTETNDKTGIFSGGLVARVPKIVAFTLQGRYSQTDGDTRDDVKINGVYNVPAFGPTGTTLVPVNFRYNDTIRTKVDATDWEGLFGSEVAITPDFSLGLLGGHGQANVKATLDGKPIIGDRWTANQAGMLYSYLTDGFALYADASGSRAEKKGSGKPEDNFNGNLIAVYRFLPVQSPLSFAGAELGASGNRIDGKTEYMKYAALVLGNGSPKSAATFKRRGLEIGRDITLTAVQRDFDARAYLLSQAARGNGWLLTAGAREQNPDKWAVYGSLLLPAGALAPKGAAKEVLDWFSLAARGEAGAVKKSVGAYLNVGNDLKIGKDDDGGMDFGLYAGYESGTRKDAAGKKQKDNKAVFGVRVGF